VDSDEDYVQHEPRQTGGGRGRGGRGGRKPKGDGMRLPPRAPRRPQAPQPPPTQHKRLVPAPDACAPARGGAGGAAAKGRGVHSARSVISAALSGGNNTSVSECTHVQMGHRYYRALFRALGYTLPESEEDDEFGDFMMRPPAKRQKLGGSWPPKHGGSAPRHMVGPSSGVDLVGPSPSSAGGGGGLGLGLGLGLGSMELPMGGQGPLAAAAAAAAVAAAGAPLRRRSTALPPAVTVAPLTQNLPPQPRPNVPLPAEVLQPFFGQGPLLPVDEEVGGLPCSRARARSCPAPPLGAGGAPASRQLAASAQPPAPSGSAALCGCMLGRREAPQMCSLRCCSLRGSRGLSSPPQPHTHTP
jgi:hypothetical protein